MDSFKRFREKNLPDKECFYRPVKDGQLMMMVKN